MPNAKDFQSFFSTELAWIEQALDLALPTPSPPATMLYEAMRYGVIPGGKRIRPLLLLCVAKTLGGNCSQALPAAVAIELLHCYTLIHDDLPCMDNDSIRRGKPTAHVKYGEALALLGGDALLTLAFDQAVQTPHAPAMVARVLAEAAGAQGVIAGQVADLQAVSGEDITPDMLTFIHTNKTGALFRAAAEMGVHAAGEGKDASVLQTCRQFGASLGLAFQYMDDLLDARTETAFSSVRILGERVVRERADQYTNEALAAIAPLGAAAASLQKLAQFMLRRET